VTAWCRARQAEQAHPATRRLLVGDLRPLAAGRPEADHAPALNQQVERRPADGAATSSATSTSGGSNPRSRIARIPAA
jgi:hypothetical protein